jgi:hypothetical protein
MRRTTRRNAKVVAVLGSLAVLGGGTTAIAASTAGHATKSAAHASSANAPTPVNLTSGEQSALEAVHTALRADTASVATPILNSDVSAGTITAAQEQSLLTMLEQGPMGGGGPGGGHPSGPPPSAG